MASRMKKRFLDTAGMTVEEAENWGRELCEMARDVPWMLGDLARWAESKLGENYSQVFPPETSPGMIQRYLGVAKLYPKLSDRQHEASWSQFMQVARKPDRQALLQAIVDQGLTTDESRKTPPANDRPKWLLAFDIHYFGHRHFYSGAGVETAVRVTQWVGRTVERLKAKGATDVVCAFEGRGSTRKELVEKAGWEDKYKDRPPKPEDLRHQLQLVRDLLEKAGFACVSVDGYEADDVLASYAQQFPGRTTLITADKDLRQCLSDHCNILLDVEWTEDETSGEALPDYKWLTAKTHTEATGIRPDQWTDLQILVGDAVDGIKGARSIGETGATSLIKTFETANAAIQAAKDEDERLLSMKRGKIMAQSLLDFEAKLEVTRQLVTLRTDCEVPMTTRIA